MAKAKDFAYINLNAQDAVVLTLTGDPPEDTTQPTPEYRISAIGFDAVFAINTIPEAWVTVAVGRNADGMQLAAIHSMAKKLTTMRKAKVTLKISGDTNTGGGTWTEGEYVIFDGYYTGFSYQKVRGQVQCVVHLLHWLCDMAFTSTISGVASPGSPVDLAYSAITEAARTGGETGVRYNITMPGILTGANLDPGKLAADFWGTVRDMLYLMSKNEALLPPSTALSGITGLCGGEMLDWEKIHKDFADNNRATAALGRIEGNAAIANSGAGSSNDISEDAVFATYGYMYGAPTPLLGTANGFGAVVSTAVADTVSQTIGGTATNQTMWDTVLAILSPFCLCLCPAIDRSVVFPDVAGWRGNAGKYWRTISADEYFSLEENTAFGRPLRGVIVCGAMANETNANADAKGKEQTTTQYLNKMLGGYANAGVVAGTGVLTYVPMPSWLADLSYAAANDADGGQDPHDTDIDGTPLPVAEKAAVDATSLCIDSEAALLNCYARQVYVSQMLRDRTAVISGPLRFDIAPGSHVKIEGNPELFAAGKEDALADAKYGQVTRVQVSINAERKVAGTVLQLQYVRNDAENENDRTSIEDHVLFRAAMNDGGLPLSPELAGQSQQLAVARKKDADAVEQQNTLNKQNSTSDEQPVARDNYDQGTPTQATDVSG